MGIVCSTLINPPQSGFIYGQDLIKEAMKL